MIDPKVIEGYLRRKISLENELEVIGDYRGSREIESQKIQIEQRLLHRVERAFYDAGQEITGLKMILLESCKKD